MVRKIAAIITESLIKEELIEEKYREEYTYVYICKIEKIICFLTVFLIGYTSGKILESMVFTVSFVLLRRYTGGYHCSSFIRCLWLTGLVSLVILNIPQYIKISMELLSAISVPSSIYIFVKGNINHPSLGLTYLERMLMVKYARITVFTEWITVIVLLLVAGVNTVSYYVLSAIIICSISMIAARMCGQDIVSTLYN